MDRKPSRSLDGIMGGNKGVAPNSVHTRKGIRRAWQPIAWKSLKIRLRLPRFNWSWRLLLAMPGRLRRFNRRTLIIGTGLVIVTVLGIANLISGSGGQTTDQLVATDPLDRLERGTPNYPTLLPDGKSAEQLGGWTRISPPNRDPVYAYTDKIDGIPVSVSQQPLPDDFKQDTATKVEEMAFSFSATKKLRVGSGTLYVGSSSSGPQSAIMEKEDLLILIKSTAPVDPGQWRDYAGSLR